MTGEKIVLRIDAEGKSGDMVSLKIGDVEFETGFCIVPDMVGRAYDQQGEMAATAILEMIAKGAAEMLTEEGGFRSLLAVRKTWGPPPGFSKGCVDPMQEGLKAIEDIKKHYARCAQEVSDGDGNG